MPKEYIVQDENERWIRVDDPEGRHVIMELDDPDEVPTPTRDEWENRFRSTQFNSWKAMYQRWLFRLDPAYPQMLDFVSYPDGGTDVLWSVFDGLVKSDPRSGTAKWEAMGKPKFLEYYFGFSDRRPTDRELAIYAHWDAVGYVPPEKEEPKGTARPVRDAGTGQTWESASAAARAIGCHIQTVYAHMSGRLKTCKGRVLEYAETDAPKRDPGAAVPGSIDAMTETEREALRAKARASGFQPKF